MDVTLLLGCSLQDDSTLRLFDALPGAPDLSESEDRTTLTWPEAGLVLNVNASQVVSAVFVRTAPASPGLPGAVRFDMSRDEVRARLGPPSLSKPATTGLFGVPGWDRYDSAAHSIHIQYGPADAAIDLVTILFPQPAPRP